MTSDSGDLVWWLGRQHVVFQWAVAAYLLRLCKPSSDEVAALGSKPSSLQKMSCACETSLCQFSWPRDAAWT